MPPPDPKPFTEVVILTTAWWEPLSDSFAKKAEDMALRLTNFVLKRKMAGYQVVVYWLVNAPDVAEQLGRAMQVAGEGEVATFVVVEMAVERDRLLSPVTLNDEALQDNQLFQELWERWEEDAADEIKRIVERQHPAAIERWPDTMLDRAGCAYYGTECRADYFDDSDLSFWFDEYAATLPYEHRAKGITWLALLQSEVAPANLDDLFDANCFMLDSMTLAYLLHSFQAVVDEDELDFDYSELAEIVPISQLFVGTYLEESDLIDICSENYDPEHLLTDALPLVVEPRVQALVDQLAGYFGSGSSLFFTLWATKAERYSVGVADRIEEALNRNLSPYKLNAFELVQPSVNALAKGGE